MKFGTFEVHPIHTGEFRLDGGAMFGVVPKILWNKLNPADEANRIAMVMRALLVRGNGRTMLIDTGVGDKTSGKFDGIYGIDRSTHTLEGSLRAAGVAAEDITDVILTHLHFDHCGGSTIASNGDLKPAFPRATYHVQRAQWDWACAPSDRDRASYFPENYQPLADAGVLRLLEGDEPICTGISLTVVNGHTFGQQLVRIEGDHHAVLYCADLIPTSAHVPAPYIMGYDLQPLVTLSEKKVILEDAVRRNDILFFEHDPITEAATVKRTEKGYAIDRAGSLADMLATGDDATESASSA